MLGLTMPETLLLQEPFVEIPDEKIREALKVVLGTSSSIDPSHLGHLHHSISSLLLLSFSFFQM